MKHPIKATLLQMREARGLSQEEFGELCDLSRSSIQRFEAGTSLPSRIAIEKIAKATGTTVAAIMGEELTAPQAVPGAIPITSRRIPLLGEIHCGEPSYAEQDFEAYVEVGATVQADFALRAKGDSMIGARIQDGDLVFIRQQDTVQSGEIAAVLIDDDAALKRVRYLPGGLTMLQAENPAYEPIFVGGEGETRCVRILGKAIAFQGDVK